MSMSPHATEVKWRFEPFRWCLCVLWLPEQHQTKRFAAFQANEEEETEALKKKVFAYISKSALLNLYGNNVSTILALHCVCIVHPNTKRKNVPCLRLLRQFFLHYINLNRCHKKTLQIWCITGAGEWNAAALIIFHQCLSQACNSLHQRTGRRRWEWRMVLTDACCRSGSAAQLEGETTHKTAEKWSENS